MATIEMESVRTEQSDPAVAARELVERLEASLGGAPKLALAFIPADRDQRAFNTALRAQLPGSTRLIGASAAGTIDRDGMHRGQVQLAGMRGDFEVGIGLGRGLSDDAFEAGESALAQACAQLGAEPESLDLETHFGVVIDDGLRFKKEELLMGVLERCPQLDLVGGGASTLSHDPTQGFATVHVDGEVATDAALVALFRTEAEWAVMRSHWYEPSGRTLTITKVDESGTRALEIDGRPAAARYAELLGQPVDKLEFGIPGGFSDGPTGMQVGSEIFLRSPWKPLPDGSILFTNLLHEGMELELMRRTEIAGSTRAFFERELPAKIAKPTASLLFHCGGRVWVATAMGELEALSDAFRSAPNPAGLEVSFEIYRGFAINTTLTVLALGDAS